jgi:sigma-B regulation protein RsbU (phosphoserine phosphatase)
MNSEFLLENRTEFHKLTAIFMHSGAKCVQLNSGNTVIYIYPPNSALEEPILKASSKSGLTLHIAGLTGDFWQSTAETLVGVLSDLITEEAELEALTAALVETQDRLVAFYELGKAIRGIIDIPRLLDLLIKEVCSLLYISGSFALVKDNERPPIVCLQCGDEDLTEDNILEIASIYQLNRQQNAFEYSGNGSTERLYGMLFPILVKEGVYALLGIYAPCAEFNSPDIKLAKALAEQIGAQLENALMVQESIVRTRLETEMKLASQVQTALLPHDLPKVAGLDIYAISLPAREVGGDFYDFILLPGHPLTFLLGDVTGKGLSSALLMTMTRTVARSAARHMPFSAPHQLVNRFNVDLLDDYSSVGMFTTAFVGVLNPVTRLLEFCNAGQSPILYLPIGGTPQLLEAQDIPIGIFEGYNYSSHSLPLSPGDVFVVASDGLPEAQNTRAELFGYERMKIALSQSHHLTAKEIAASLFGAIAEFTENQSQDDDQTIIIIKIQSAQPSTLVISATYQNVRLVDESLRLMLMNAHILEPVISACELAFHELLTNLVDHAYNGDTTGQISVFLSLEPNRIVMETRDFGIRAELDLANISMPDPLDLAEGGYGMAIIKAQVDEVLYYSEGGQNVWRLIKNRN